MILGIKDLINSPQSDSTITLDGAQTRMPSQSAIQNKLKKN
jgi:hypothetical protein